MSSLSDLPLQPSVIRRVTRLRGICLESVLSANLCASRGGSGYAKCCRYVMSPAMEGGSQQNIGHYSPSYLPIDDCFNFDLPNPTVPKFHWTQDFHYRFVECVNLLGGADKATPKTILKLMDTEGLKIYDVKSHLQQYRIAKYMKESEEGRSEKMTCVSEEAHTDALRMQLDVQRQIHEQLETEEQRRQLQMMFDLQQNYKNGGLIEKQNPNSTCPDDLSSSVDDMTIADDSRKNNSKCI